MPLKSWRSAEWLCRNDPFFLWKQTASIWVTFALLEEKNSFHYFYHCYPCRISSALGEHSSLLCLVNQQSYELSSKWGLSTCPGWLSAYALSYSCAVLLQEKGCGGVWHGLGILLWLVMMTEPKRKWFDVPKWVHGHFLLAEGYEESFLTCELSKFVTDIEKMEVVSHNEALETQPLKTPTMCNSSGFSSDELTPFDRDNAAVYLAGHSSLLIAGIRWELRVTAWWGVKLLAWEQTGTQ